MRFLRNVIPEAEVLCSLEPDELGLRMLPVLAEWVDNQDLWGPLTLDNFIGIQVSKPGLTVFSDQYSENPEVQHAIREAWAWLEGSALLIYYPGFREPNTARSLSRRARRLAQEPDPRKLFAARRIPKEALHPTIREDVWTLYHRGKYDTAVFEAMKAVEVAVRQATPCVDTSLLGVKLMRAAFKPETGPLTDSTVDGGEQVARMELFAGAIGSYKNPHSHRNVALDDPDETAEIIMLANHLLRIVAARVEATSKP